MFASMSSCCRSRKPPEGETQPLLQQQTDDTALQQKLKEKLHGLEIIEALSKGYMPTTDQALLLLRALLLSDFLNPDNPTLSRTGRELAKDCRSSVRVLMEMLREKNGGDQLQEIIFHLSRSTASVNTGSIASRASASKVKADTEAGI